MRAQPRLQSARPGSGQRRHAATGSHASPCPAKWNVHRKVAFVDTEGTFRPERVRAIAARFNLDPDAVLDNVRISPPWGVMLEGQLQPNCGLATHACVRACAQATTVGKVTPVACMATACMPEASSYATTPCSPATPAPCPPRRSQIPQILYARAYTHEAQLDLLAGVAAKMVDEPFKLLIVDSIMANFRWGEEGPTERGMPTHAQVAGWGAACRACCLTALQLMGLTMAAPGARGAARSGMS